jgi:hypothetical protein
VAQRLLPLRDKPEEMVSKGSSFHHACPPRSCRCVQRTALTVWRFVSHMQILVVSVGAYVCSVLGIILMYVWYAPSLTCKINILFITITLILVLLMTLVSMSTKVKWHALISKRITNVFEAEFCFCFCFCFLVHEMIRSRQDIWRQG